MGEYEEEKEEEEEKAKPKVKLRLLGIHWKNCVKRQCFIKWSLALFSQKGDLFGGLSLYKQALNAGGCASKTHADCC